MTIEPGDIVQIAAPAWARFGERLRSDLPHLEWLVVHLDRLERVSPSGGSTDIEWDDAAPTIAWMCFDAFTSDVRARHFKLAGVAPSLELAHTSYAGLDAPYWQGLRDRGVATTDAHLAGTPMSEYVFGRVLEWFQRPAGWNDAQATREWRGGEFREIRGTRWLVAGMGAIGEQVAVKAQAFGAHVTGVRRTISGDEPADEMVTLDNIGAAAASADVLVFSLPSTPDTEGLVDADFLAALSPGALLVNVGRGSLVDEQALRNALDNGHLGGAILDVMATEPLPPDHWMWEHPKVMMTAHKSASGTGRHERSYTHFVGAMRARHAAQSS